MKHTLSLYLFYFLLAPNAYTLVKVIDNKGTINEVENSKWFFQSIRVLFIMLLLKISRYREN
jgi:hypothetical protein